MSVSKELVDIIKGSEDKGTKPYDTPATVTRVDGSTVWVHIPGGVDETPVKKTINAKAGDTVQVRVSGGSAWLNGNASAPPTDDTQANLAVEYALVAGNAADSAVKSANIASEAAADAKATADSVHGIATQALADAATAKGAADNASEYAARAFGNLSTVQSITETLNWITAHGTMTLTSDVSLDPTHVYFVVDAGGDYTVNGVTYAIVTEPDVADIGTYYELSIDESLNNYVGTHLALTSEGLWLLPASSGTNKVLIATGAGTQYTTAGTYILDSNNNTLASFKADGATMSASDGTIIAHLGYGPGANAGGGTSTKPYYTIGFRSGNVGNYSVSEGYDTTASAYGSHAEGTLTKARGLMAHAEGGSCVADGDYSHAEGQGNFATGDYAHAEGYDSSATGKAAHAEGAHTASGYAFSHAQNVGTVATHAVAQTVMGTYNIADTTPLPVGPHGSATIDGRLYASSDFGNYALIIGNGTADNARSNALTVDWAGNVVASGGLTLNGTDAVVDYIVEQGTDTKTNITWTYRKWNSGISECWGRFSLTVTSTTSWGSIYYTPAQTATFPTSLFTGVPTVSLSTANSTVVGWGGANSISSSSVNVLLYRPTSASAGTATIDIVAKGKWI